MSIKQILIFYCILSQIQYYCLEKSKPNEPSWDTVKQRGSHGRMCRTIQVLVMITTATSKPSFTQEGSAGYTVGQILLV